MPRTDRSARTDVGDRDENEFWGDRDIGATDPLVASTDVVDAIVKYLPCKLRGHTFSHSRHDRDRDVVCQRCGTQRLQAFDDTGCITSLTYYFPPGFHQMP
jgi:hypothetical protein